MGIAPWCSAEDRGPRNEAAAVPFSHSTYPHPGYISNLAAAVRVITYGVRALVGATGEQGLVFDDWDQPPAQSKDLELCFRHLEPNPDGIKFFNMYRIARAKP